MSEPAPQATPFAIIGGGPAGLMAAEVLASHGVQVDLFDAMPSVGRKFLLAGRGGLNLTHSEPFEDFLARFGSQREALEPALRAFTPDDLCAWAHGLGVETFVGTSGRVFPVSMKAAPLLRAWLQQLKRTGVAVHTRHRWLGWTPDGQLRFQTPKGECLVDANTTILALGGASWSRLGSDGAWVKVLSEHGAHIEPLRPANCGFDVAPTAPDRQGWSEHLRTRFAGQPLKPVAVRFIDLAGHEHVRQGEFVLTETGIEGSLIYAFSAMLRDTIEIQGSATLKLDLLPAHTLAQVEAEVKRPRGPRSLSTHLKSRLGLQGVKMSLLHECLDAPTLADSKALALAIKGLPLRLIRPRPVDEAISTAGGLAFNSIDSRYRLLTHPRKVYSAGEMLDWEAPTGGYLLTASMATGRAAAFGALADRANH